MIRLSAHMRAALWMCGTLVSFIGMAVAARELSQHMGTFQILFYRSLVGLMVLAPLVLHERARYLRTRRLFGHVARNGVHFAAQYCWVLGIALLPLAEVFALEFTMPIWVALLAALFLGERITRPRLVAVLAGFLGVLVILRPGVAAINPASFAVLAAALGYAASIVVTKALTRSEAPLTIIFYMALIQLPLGLVPASFHWVWPVWADAPWIAIVGLAALSAHYTMAHALRLADASIILPIDFLRVPLVALVGYIAYAEGLSAWVGLGALIVFAANYYMLRAEGRR